MGRRVAQWRVRRNMTQQQFADRLGKSKSWVDKVERGVRRLERVSNLREVAETLRIDVEVLLAARPVRPTPVAAGVDGIRTALARYDLSGADRPPLVEELRARLEHAEQSYRHARYPALLALLPGLLDAAREAHAARPGATDALLVSVYALIALVLVKVDQGELAWLAADRGMTVALANRDPQVAAVATVSLSQALRSRGRRRSALDAALVAADRIGAHDCSGASVALRGTLFLQAALAAAGGGDERLARQSCDQAAKIARDLGADGTAARAAVAAVAADPGSGGAGPGGAGCRGAGCGGAVSGGAVIGVGGFGRAAVEAAWVVADAALGDVTTATARHERLVAGDEWRWLPPEHRAAYLLDVARAYALAGDMRRAGQTVLDAERTARSEVHDRPAVRKLVAVVWRSADAPSGLAQLAATLHAT
ncbi:Transcriptional regulator, contains XRE-family HTH domain [Micromonospora coriariae]|uniref:Transcriptional regulator, contains XRE-family HTH domain n=1 Tax=Micromonospora coriariae TaxID=285665 RepID=A0A1C4UGW3_9ACTN|nr:Transcriptional regulator, contains XRE-family HTH domain [Micromonospora coriariae]